MVLEKYMLKIVTLHSQVCATIHLEKKMISVCKINALGIQHR